MLVVEAEGRSGGLGLIWREAVDINLLSLSNNHIDVEVHITGDQPWRLTGFYGEPNRNLRSRTWNLLRTLARDSNLPWCIIGDMNNIVSQNDKKGGAAYRQNLIDGFNNVLDEIQVADLELNGHPYTWERGRNTDAWIETRLDRALANSIWCQLFPLPLAKLYNLEGSPSDHSPIFLALNNKQENVCKKKFRFENAWLLEPLCAQIVHDSWEDAAEHDIVTKVRQCGESLQIWGREITGCFNRRIKECKLRLKQLRSARDDHSMEQYKDAKQQLFLILDQREIFWRQRSKQLWLQSGDKNTKYFHASCNSRRRSNHIQKLKDDNGVWLNWQSGLQHYILSHYQNLFTASNTDASRVLECIPQSINQIQNSELVKEVTDEEVRDALFQMNPDKAPGPDGMTPAFFQKHWRIVGRDIINLTKHFFRTGEIIQGLNDTNLVLIPKKTNPTLVGELRPIALCNVIMKVITKVMANRLKLVLESVISDTQSAFIPGRLISDNVMVSYEIMHYLKCKRVGKDGYMALKLDMSKAYDRVEWEFLKAILRKMGFSEWWVKLVLQCVSTVSYNIVHGNQEMGPFKPTRGIRQGDPLSPYLFIICAEGLSALIRSFEHKQWIHGVRICRKAPSVTHMFFADDSYVYCKADYAEASRILEILQIYEEASGQKINKEKSSVFFSSNVIQYN